MYSSSNVCCFVLSNNGKNSKCKQTKNGLLIYPFSIFTLSLSLSPTHRQIYVCCKSARTDIFISICTFKVCHSPCNAFTVQFLM